MSVLRPGLRRGEGSTGGRESAVAVGGPIALHPGSGDSGMAAGAPWRLRRSARRLVFDSSAAAGPTVCTKACTVEGRASLNDPVLLVGGGEDACALVVSIPAEGQAGLPRILWFGDWYGMPGDAPEAAGVPSRTIPGAGIRAAPLPRQRWGARLDEAPVVALVPGAGSGYAAAPGIEFRRDDGLWRFAPEYCELTADADRNVLCVAQQDPAAGLRIETALQLDSVTGALRAASRLINIATGTDAHSVDLHWLAAVTVPLPFWCSEATDFAGDWCAEFRRETTPLGEASWVREVREGRSSHRHYPGFLLGEAGAAARAGRMLAVQFAWSGDHRLRVDRLADGSRVLQAGVLLQPGEVRLAPGESFDSPDLWIGCSRRGLDGIAARMHAVCRRHVLPSTGQRWPRPVHLNTWEAIYFDHRPEALLALADAAAAVGVERFVLDDGWFEGRRDDLRALGDWRVDGERYPDGLTPLIERVRGHGMEFGLWVEPEMVNDDSALARMHPDWIRGPGQGRGPALTGRNQRVLDLTRPEVVEHLFAALDSLLSAHEIGYLKWDHNRVLTEQALAGSAGHHGQTLAVHALLDRIRAAHPDVEIESCASGGGRADWGMLARTHRVWTSDSNDPVVRARIMAGVTPLLPPEVTGVHVGPERAHTTGRVTSLDFRAAVALLGAFGLELDLRILDAAQRARLEAHIARYKRWRDVVHGGRMATPVDDADHLVRVSTAQDRGRALVVALRMDDREPGRGIRFQLADLDPALRYRVRLAAPEPDPELRPAPAGVGAFRGEGALVDGAWLVSVGLSLQLTAPQSAIVLELEAE